MKFALIDGNRSEAFKGAKGICPSCGLELIAKCGELKINHWAHKAVINCDTWWENETEWHRSWKNQFPIEWQEVVQFDNKGEKHIADVKTVSNWVIEFQHSFLKPEERHSRNTFYPKLVWVVDGTRRKRDRSQIQKVLNESVKLQLGNVRIFQVSFPEESMLLKEWLSCSSHVFFDFQELEESKQLPLWYLLPQASNSKAYLIAFSRNEFIQLHLNNGFDELALELVPNIRNKLINSERRNSNVSANYFLSRGHRPRRSRRF